jgi:hypothetical protein
VEKGVPKLAERKATAVFTVVFSPELASPGAEL